MVRAGVSAGVSRAASNRFPRSGPPAFRRGGCRALGATPPKPLRADGPVTQRGVLDPRRVTASAGQVRTGIETRSDRGDRRRPRRPQL